MDGGSTVHWTSGTTQYKTSGTVPWYCIEIYAFLQKLNTAHAWASTQRAECDLQLPGLTFRAEGSF